MIDKRYLFSLAAISAIGAAGCGEPGPGSSAGRRSTSGEEIVSVKSALTAGAWTRIGDYSSTQNPETFQLLMDGSVLSLDGGVVNTWHRLIPDPITGYPGGKWVPAASSHFGRQGFATGMLRDGRYFICGGENTNYPAPHSKCEVYTPGVNYPVGEWRDVPDFPNGDVEDGVVAPFPDGRLLVGAKSNQLMIFDPTLCPAGASICPSDPTRCSVNGSCLSPVWTSVPALPAGLGVDESSLAILQDGNILFGQDGAARFLTGSPGWLNIPKPAGYNNPFGPPDASEGAPLLTLYDGRVFIASATSFNAIYTPSSDSLANVATTPGPAGSRMDENDQVVMPNGDILAAVVGADFKGPYSFYEYSPPDNTFPAGNFLPVQTGAPSYDAANVIQTPLPDGSVLVGHTSSNQIFVYRHAGSQLTTFTKPTITSVTGPVNGVYTLTGTNLNGLTNGANRDDEGQNYTSFPVVWVSGRQWTQYVTVTSNSTMAIVPNASSTITFTLPAGTPHGPLTLALSASGWLSANSVGISNGPPIVGPAQSLLLLD